MTQTRCHHTYIRHDVVTEVFQNGMHAQCNNRSVSYQTIEDQIFIYPLKNKATNQKAHSRTRCICVCACVCVCVRVRFSRVSPSPRRASCVACSCVLVSLARQIVPSSARARSNKQKTNCYTSTWN